TSASKWSRSSPASKRRLLPVHKKPRLARGFLFFAFARHPGERRDPVFDFAVRIEGKGSSWIPAFAGMTSQGEATTKAKQPSAPWCNVPASENGGQRWKDGSCCWCLRCWR